MHFRDGFLGIVEFFVEDVGGAAVCVDCIIVLAFRWHQDGARRQGQLTHWVQRQFQVLDNAVLAKDFAQMLFFNILGELFHNDLEQLALFQSCKAGPLICAILE